jgi:hypothetical protein
MARPRTDPNDLAAQLDAKSVTILRMIAGHHRDFVTTNDVKRKHGWDNAVVLRRFRKLDSLGLADMREADDINLTYDHSLPRPPKYIDRRDRDRIQSVLTAWDGRGTLSPAQLTDEIDDIDHRIDATEDHLRDHIDAVERKLDGVVRQQAHTQRDRAQLSRAAKPAGYGIIGALVTSLVVLVGISLATPEMVAVVLVAALVVIAVGFGDV